MNARATALRTAVAAMFVALTVLVAYLPTIPGSALKFAGFPLLLGGLLVGPRTGFAVGCVTDLINFAFHPTGVFFPGFTLTQGLTAMIPGLLARGMDPLTGRSLEVDEPERRPGERPPTLGLDGPIVAYLRLLGMFAISKVLTSVLLVSFFTSKLVGTPLVYELTQRSLIQAIHVPVYALLSLAVLQGLAGSDLYGRILKARR